MKTHWLFPNKEIEFNVFEEEYKATINRDIHWWEVI